MIVANVATLSDLGSVSPPVGNPPAPRTAEYAPRHTEKIEQQQKAGQERTEGQVDPAALQKAVEQLQATANMVDVRLQFKVDDASGIVQVIVTNRDTEEVIREIPSSDVLKAAARLREVIGLLIDTTA